MAVHVVFDVVERFEVNYRC